MAYIEPNSTIKVLRGVPLDTTYDHTIYFDSLSDQSTYFSSKTKYTLTRNTYQRVNKNSMRVNLLSDNIYDCNYLMFQNTNFGNKWFYAFIKEINYVNNVTSEIVYEIDDMQTWHFDYQLDQCFVEREHSVLDGFGDNIIPEDVQTGDIEITSPTDKHTSQDGYGCWYNSGLGICLIAPFTVTDYDPIHIDSDDMSEMYGGNIGNEDGYFSGFKINYTTATTQGIASMEEILNNDDVLAMSDNILAIVEFPVTLINDVRNPDLSSDESAFPHNSRIHTKTVGFRPNPYLPQTNINYKLNCYPYNYLMISNGTEDKIYQYEYFSGNTCEFAVYAALGVNPEITLVPRNYRGADENWNEAFSCQNYPICSWNTDIFKAYMAQNRGKNVAKFTSDLVNIGTAYGSGSGLLLGGSVMHAISDIISEPAKWYDLQRQGRTGKGQFSGSAFQQNLLCGFQVYHCHIREDYTNIISSYFTRFGYQTNITKVPNRNVRPHWTYTKTVDCTITGSIPADSAKHICSIYNNGITFWRNPSEIGDYSLDNSAVAQT